MVRLDQFLKISRLVKRRPLAKEICDLGAVRVNSHAAKPGHEINVGDLVEISFWNRQIKLEILEIPESNVSKERAAQLYRVLEQYFKEQGL